MSWTVEDLQEEVGRIWQATPTPAPPAMLPGLENKAWVNREKAKPHGGASGTQLLGRTNATVSLHDQHLVFTGCPTSLSGVTLGRLQLKIAGTALRLTGVPVITRGGNISIARSEV